MTFLAAILDKVVQYLREVSVYINHNPAESFVFAYRLILIANSFLQLRKDAQAQNSNARMIDAYQTIGPAIKLMTAETTVMKAPLMDRDVVSI